MKQFSGSLWSTAEGPEDAPLLMNMQQLLSSELGSGAAISELYLGEERYRNIMALSPLIPWVANPRGGLTDLDARGLACTGLTYEECLGNGFLTAIHPGDRAVVISAWKEASKKGAPFEYEMRLHLKVGGYAWHRTRAAPHMNLDGEISCWYGTIENIDEQKLAGQALFWAANHDDLTGLWNRRAFLRGLNTALASASGSDAEVAVLLIDLDNFKLLNDRFGHDAGDAILKELSERLQQCCAGEASVGRLGGDEFAMFILTADRTHLDSAIAEIIHALAAPCTFNGQTHLCRASIGVAVCPEHGEVADLLCKNADLALYEAKGTGGGVRYFQSVMRAGLQVRMSQLSMARDALDEGRILPFYQPKIDLRTGAVAGFEALLRWKTDRHGVLSPGSIAAALEDVELGMALDERIFELVAADIKGWARGGLRFGRIAINVSAAEFRQEGFAELILDRIRGACITPHLIELEITETVFLGRSPRKILSTFEVLREAGVTVALDDFGTGYASLIHLRQFPVDALKIDCSFVKTLEDAQNAAIVDAILGLGRSFKIGTVAEGVETAEQAHRLYQMGCNIVQGYLFSPAVPAADVPALLTPARFTWQKPERRSRLDRRQGAARIVRNTGAWSHLSRPV